MYVSVNNSSEVFKIASPLYLGLAMLVDKRHLFSVVPADKHNTVVATRRPLVTS
jgi:hypothetical protein